MNLPKRSFDVSPASKFSDQSSFIFCQAFSCLPSRQDNLQGLYKYFRLELNLKYLPYRFFSPQRITVPGANVVQIPVYTSLLYPASRWGGRLLLLTAVHNNQGFL
jgi:hypothetical protein